MAKLPRKLYIYNRNSIANKTVLELFGFFCQIHCLMLLVTRKKVIEYPVHCPFAVKQSFVVIYPLHS